jgi:hypothetical protein
VRIEPQAGIEQVARVGVGIAMARNWSSDVSALKSEPRARRPACTS